MLNNKISLIIPVYNVSAYIESCLSSVLKQTYPNFEALVVDDGSPDNSIELAKDIIGNDPRFHIITKKNGGLGSARNLGLKHATGEYIAFLDSDDTIEPDFLECLIKKITLEKADICVCAMNYISEDGQHIKINYSNATDYYQKKDILLTLRSITSFMCDKLFKRNVFDGVYFNENITYEDTHLCFRLLYNKKIVSINKPLYNYLQRAGSIMHQYDENYLNSRLAVSQSYKDFLYEENIYDVYANYYQYSYLVNYVFYAAINFAQYSPNYSIDMKFLFKTVDKDIFSTRNILKFISKDKVRMMSLLLIKHTPILFKYVVKFKEKSL
ncbi:MAG: glycosyltransferase family 2 protein [Neisseriaceae bacterium]|nr:glycosyltransferase family 2 protein [Neisseriaceae bacterium]